MAEEKQYMISAQSLQNYSDLTREFIQMYEKRESVHEQLIEKTDGFRNITDYAVEKVRSL